MPNILTPTAALEAYRLGKIAERLLVDAGARDYTPAELLLLETAHAHQLIPGRYLADFDFFLHTS